LRDDGNFSQVVKIANFRALTGRTDFLSDDFVQCERWNGYRCKIQEFEIALVDLRRFLNRQDGPLPHAHLNFDLLAGGVAVMCANGISGAPFVGEIPVFVPVETKADAMVSLVQCFH